MEKQIEGKIGELSPPEEELSAEQTAAAQGGLCPPDPCFVNSQTLAGAVGPETAVKTLGRVTLPPPPTGDAGIIMPPAVK